MSDLAAHFSAAATSADCIHVKNIQLSSPVSAPDVWGNLKEQPALVSVHLSLTKGFSTASDADKLDDSTIHYGNLTKRIRSNCGQDCTTLDQVLAATESAIHGLALKTNDNFIVARSAVEVHLPKASMLGTEVLITSTTSYDQTGKSCDVTRIFSVKDVTIPTLIGVNAYERTMKQPLVVSFTLQYTHCSSSSFDERHQKALFDVEKTLVQVGLTNLKNVGLMNTSDMIADHSGYNL